MPRRVFAYVRVSGAEQGRTGTSLEGQRGELVAYCKAHKLPAPIVHVEVESASAEKLEARVQLRALLREAAPGDLVLVTKVDRWSRDIVHAVQSVRALVKRGVGFTAIGEGIDATTSNGDSQLGIMAWAADNERKRIKERMVGTRKVLRAQGLYVEGLPPFAYKRGKDRRLHVIAGEAPIVRQMYRRVLRGSSLNGVSDWLKDEHPGVRRWVKSYVARLLRTRTYLGEVLTPSGDWVASHEGIVTRDIWERTQVALSSRRLSGRKHSDVARTATWLLRGLAVCGHCGRRMGSAYKGPTDYYLCAKRASDRSCRNGYMPVLATDAAMAALVLARLGELRAELGRPSKAAPVSAAGKDYEKARRALVLRRERLIDGLESGLDRETFRTRMARIDAELGAIEVDAAGATRGTAVVPPAKRRELLADVRMLEKAWGAMTVAERREVVRRLATRIALTSGAAPVPEWRSLVDLAEETPENELG